MPIKRYIRKVLKKLFPYRMAVHDDRKRLEKIMPNTQLTREQWIETIKEQYRRKVGHDLNLDAPRRYTEKIQWRKLNDNQPIYSVLADKYAVRKWVKERIGEEYLIPLLGVWQRAEDIDFDRLPNSFVLKTNNASSAIIIVRNKKDIKRKHIIEKLNHWLAYPFWAERGQFHYKAIKPVIIAEKLMECEGTKDLPDYKIYCFDGKPYCCSVDIDRYHGHKQVNFDVNWHRLDWRFKACEDYTGDIEKPAQYETMLRLAEKLSEGFSHVRVDLYLIKQRIYFGEMTFTPWSGITRLVPDEFDFVLGEQWNIDEAQVK